METRPAPSTQDSRDDDSHCKSIFLSVVCLRLHGLSQFPSALAFMILRKQSETSVQRLLLYELESTFFNLYCCFEPARPGYSEQKISEY